MGLRITSGKFKGRKIKTGSIDELSEREGLRPTSARVRESVFNILMGRVVGAVFLDLYAGTGAIGVEAMSRGAAEVFFVEADARAAAALDDTLSDCGCRPKAHIVNARGVDFLRRAEAEGIRFDVVYLDPPYASGELPVALKALGTGAVLNASALVLAEHRRGDGPPDEAGRLKLKKKYHYGDTSLKVYNLSR